ncbi:MAG: 3-phosphoshikimate 1-carboxyvinyltransferase [Ignavibacteria bacterium]
MQRQIKKIKSVNGELMLPGDKSISHRSVIFSSMANGLSIIENLSGAEDVASTINCLKQSGCLFKQKNNLLYITGRGFKGLTKPSAPLDAGNSGTTTRLLFGLLSVQNFESTITGDNSLSKRPMKRVMEPLNLMGVAFKEPDKFTLPVTILPSENMHAIRHKLQVASAQVKSAILIAGLHFNALTVVSEFTPTRNHTENLLNLKVEKSENYTNIYVSKADYPKPGQYLIPSDISTAAFFMALALIANNARLLIKNVGLNPSRTGIINIFKQMGGRIEILNQSVRMGELYGDISICESTLNNIKISEEIIPNIIDEIPILAIAGLFATGNFRIEGAKELRFKESDRIMAMCYNFRLLGLDVDEFEDGFEVSGKIKNSSIVFESFHDHRIAMAFSILSALSDTGGIINNFECIGISNPGFLSQLESISG